MLLDKMYNVLFSMSFLNGLNCQRIVLFVCTFKIINRYYSFKLNFRQNRSKASNPKHLSTIFLDNQFNTLGKNPASETRTDEVLNGREEKQDFASGQLSR